MSDGSAIEGFGIEHGEPQWCVVYEATTDRVLHIHEYVPLAEEQPLDPDELAKQALSVGVAYDAKDVRVAHPDRDVAPPDRHLVRVADGRIVLEPVDMEMLEKLAAEAED